MGRLLSICIRIIFFYSFLSFLVPIGSMKTTGIGLIMVICTLMIKSLKNQNFPFLIFSLFIISYCIVPLGYLFGTSNHIIDHVTFVETHSTVFVTSQCLLLFLSSFLMVARFDIPPCCRKQKSLMSISNSNGYIISVIIAILCIILGVSGENIFEAGGYGQGTNERSSLYEYGIIFISLSLIYSKTHAQRNLVYLLCICFILKDLIYGGRVSSVMLILAVFMLNFLNKFSFKQVLIAVACGYVFFQFWGYFRSEASSSGFDIKEADGNAQFVIYASMRVHYLIENGILNLSNRIYSFFCFLASSVIPSSYLPDIANLSSYKTSEYYSGGGGLVSSFFYCWGWMPGVVVIAVWIGKVINKFFHTKSIYWKFYSLLLIVTTPRWFAYYPSQIFKYAVYGVLAFYLINKLSKSPIHQ